MIQKFRAKYDTSNGRVGKRVFTQISRQYELYIFLVPALLYFLTFHYLPMYGLQIAFRDFSAGLGITGSPWVGLKHFLRFVHSYSFWRLIRNTIGISLYSLIVGFPAPIILALVVNEISSRKFKRLVQTITYMPHFISTVVMVSMIMIFLHPQYGIINSMTGILGLPSVHFMTQENMFKSIYVISEVWQRAGWGSIIYLAALASVDPSLHESAMIDGASRLKRIWHINLPGIKPTIVILFILNVGGLMTVGFEKMFLMQNPMNLASSEIISTYIYKVGLLRAQYSFSAAVGLFNSVINFILLLSANHLAKRINEISLF
jgi:putative aldouronate transport system permease protein